MKYRRTLVQHDVYVYNIHRLTQSNWSDQFRDNSLHTIVLTYNQVTDPAF